MRRILVLAAVAALLAVLAPAAKAGPPGDPFVGSWESIDGFDDSRIWLRVGGVNHHVVYQEDGLSICLFGFGQFVGGSALGFATIEGNTLTFSATVYCNLRGGRTAHPDFDPNDFEFIYDPNTDTLLAAGNCYHRSGAPAC